MSTCVAITAKGRPCKRAAMEGSDRCSFHLSTAPGNRSKLTPDMPDKLAALLRAGNYMGVAARASGIAHRTLQEWLQRGLSHRPEDELYRELREKVDKARAEGEALHVARIAKAAEEDWHASAWFLERSYPERWARSQPRPFEPSELPVSHEPPPPAPGLFDEVDELAAQRAKRL